MTDPATGDPVEVSREAIEYADAKVYGYTRPRITMDQRSQIKNPSMMKYVCGFCATNHHNNCKTAVRSGQGHIMICPCIEHPEPRPFCTECGNKDIDELDEKLWLCLDVPDCEARVRARVRKDPQVALIHESYARSYDTTKADKIKKAVARDRNPGRPSTGKCLCCGETTGGGKFLPGHDARLVSQTAAKVAAGADPIKTLEEFKALGVSDALYGKLQRKLERL